MRNVQEIKNLTSLKEIESNNLFIYFQSFNVLLYDQVYVSQGGITIPDKRFNRLIFLNGLRDYHLLLCLLWLNKLFFKRLVFNVDRLESQDLNFLITLFNTLLFDFDVVLHFIRLIILLTYQVSKSFLHIKIEV